MNELRTGSPDLDTDERWQLAQRIARSEPFRRAPRLRAFLLFIVERTLRDGAAELNEYEVGLNVFGRPKDFSPSEDSIVRSSARQLRSKLQEYFAGDGRGEKRKIVVPKGSYVPEFIDAVESILIPAAVAPPASSPLQVGRAPMMALATLCVALAAACVYLLSRPDGPARESLAQRNFLFTIFPQPEADVSLVFCDSALVMANSFRPNHLTLDDYIRREDQTPIPAPPGSYGRFSADGRLITSFRDMAFLQRLNGVWNRRGHLVIRHSRLMQARDFRLGNFILLGGPVSNPWVTLFEPQLNFQFAVDPDSHRVGFRNLHPQAGEDSFYWTSQAEWGKGLSYATIAVLPNLSDSGRVLLLSGVGAVGSEGAGDSVLSRDLFAKIEPILRGHERDLQAFEMLVEVKAVDGAVMGANLRAYRFSQRQPTGMAKSAPW